MGRRRKKETEEEYKLLNHDAWWKNGIELIFVIIVCVGFLGYGLVLLIWPLISFGLYTSGGFLAGILKMLL